MTGTNFDYVLAVLAGAILGSFFYLLYCAACWLVRGLHTARLLAQEEVAYRQARRQIRSLTRRFYLDLAEAERDDRRREGR